MQEPPLVLLRGGDPIGFQTPHPPQTPVPQPSVAFSLSPPAPPHTHSHTPHHVTYHKHIHTPHHIPQTYTPPPHHSTNTSTPHIDQHRHTTPTPQTRKTTHTHTHTHTVMQSSLHTYFSVRKLAENKGDRETMLNDTREI